MIPILTGDDRREAIRLREAFEAAGLPSQFVDARGVAAQRPAFLLTHVSTVADVAPHVSSILAFGGDDRAGAALNCVRAGASEYLPRGVDEAIAVATVKAQLARLDGPAGGAIAVSESAKAVFDLARRVAQSDISVLIGGESGSGKEVLARFLHDTSPRASAAFVAVNCAAIPETMLEALLFGHEKGAFTGATDRRLGKFEIADHGTLLLDEITEMPVGLQAKLLRALQEREVERLGSHRTVKIDVRVVATSNRDLMRAVEDGLLREDLYYRLSVLPLTLPPLRERTEDVMPLAEHFLRKYAHSRLILGDGAIERLESHTWPGNVRELENTIQRAVVLTRGMEIQAADLGLDAVRRVKVANSLGDRMRDTEGELLLKTLAAKNGVRKKTAEHLGISERTLRYKLKDLKERGLM